MKPLFLFLIFVIILAQSASAAYSAPLEETNQTTVEGTFVQVSKLPPPKNNPYPDCYYTAILDIEHIASGRSIPKKVVLVLPGFFSREYAPEARFKVGDKVHALVVPFASMPDKVRQTQQADEVEDVDLDFYFPKQIALIQKIQHAPNPVPFADKRKSNDPVTLQPVDLKARAARKEQMRHDLDEINRLLAAHGGDWDKWYDSLKDFRDQYKKQYDAKAQRWVGDSFFSAGYLDDGKVYSQEFVKSVIAFKNFLAARNVDLILVRVPNKGEVVDDLFVPPPPDQVSNPYLLRMYKELLEADVEIITDIIPRAKAERLKYPLLYWYQEFPEPHPAEGIAWVIAEAFAERVRRYSRVQSTPKKVFALKQAATTQGWLGFTWPAGNPKFSSTDYVRYSIVTDSKGKPVQLTQGLDSPVLLLGSSFIAAPSFAMGATIPHYFAYLAGIAPDLVHRNDADFMMPRNIAREGDDFLRNRSVCLFPFVPWTAFKALASLPIFDPVKSTKTLLASYAGPAMKAAIEFLPESAEGVLSYSSDGLLHIQSVNEETGIIRIKVPDAVSDFPFFSLEIEFASKDRTNVTVKYAGQVDSIKRSETQVKNEEVFAFVTKSSKLVDIDFKGSRLIKSPTAIKGVKFFGVRQPSTY